MKQDIYQAIQICRTLIGYDITVTTDKEIEDAVVKVKKLLNLDENTVLLVKKELQTIYSTQIDTFRILVGRERCVPWLKDFKAKDLSEWKFWKRYVEYLGQKSFAPKIINNLDLLTDKILDNLFNPQIKDVKICKKGLVVGQVQSGKTSNYTGLICKAADSGFNFIIVLAGIHNNLRSQTQSRLDEGFLGFDTQFERVYANNEQNKIGVGRSTLYSNLVAHSITTSEEKGDFTKKAAGVVNFNTSDPILLVVKKNVSVLKRLFLWLQTQTTTDNKICSKSVLVIDDEADNASVNTNKPETDPTKINGFIRNIIDIFNRSAYVGYTATPFANIFIARDDSDLFPRDFIINLPAPSNYIGPDKIFGTSLVPDENNDDLLPIVFPIKDYNSFVPDKHKKEDPKPMFDEIPESLKRAIKCFIVTCAIRIARGQENKHNSMLIHLSRYQVWQNNIKDIVDHWFQYYKNEIEANDPTVLEEMRCVFEEDTKDYTSYVSITKNIKNSSLSNIDNNLYVHSWNEIKPLLKRAVQKIIVKSINGSSGDVIDYQAEKNGVSVIAVGGDKLSRGLTLEGLSISYFLRASKMYDTLMQMGRWFGYRPGYVDLCRLFTSPELNEWFRHITIASEELRDEFNYLAESGQTPEQYALKVRQHDGALQITALNKMRNTHTIEVSWAGKLRETYQLPMDKGLKQKNLIATQNFINKLGSFEKTKRGDNYLWRNVSYEDICEFFSNFNVAKSLKKVNFELICQYIKNLAGVGELVSWSVVLMNKEKSTKTYDFGKGIEAGCFKRTRAEDTDYDTYFIRKNHIVGDPQDEFLDLDKELMDKALEETKRIMENEGKEWEKEYPSPKIVREKFRDVSNPILMIYPLNPKFANIKLDENGPIMSGTISFDEKDSPFIGLAMAFPHSNTKDNAVKYTINREEEFAEIEDIFDLENDN